MTAEEFERIIELSKWSINCCLGGVYPADDVTPLLQRTPRCQHQVEHAPVLRRRAGYIEVVLEAGSIRLEPEVA